LGKQVQVFYELPRIIPENTTNRNRKYLTFRVAGNRSSIRSLLAAPLRDSSPAVNHPHLSCVYFRQISPDIFRLILAFDNSPRLVNRVLTCKIQIIDNNAVRVWHQIDDLRLSHRILEPRFTIGQGRCRHPIFGTRHRDHVHHPTDSV
jgi:hypothetical protein